MNKNTIINLLRNIRRKYKEKVKKYKVKGSYAIQIDEIDDRAIKVAKVFYGNNKSKIVPIDKVGTYQSKF